MRKRIYAMLLAAVVLAVAVPAAITYAEKGSENDLFYDELYLEPVASEPEKIFDGEIDIPIPESWVGRIEIVKQGDDVVAFKSPNGRLFAIAAFTDDSWEDVEGAIALKKGKDGRTYVWLAEKTGGMSPIIKDQERMLKEAKRIRRTLLRQYEFYEDRLTISDLELAEQDESLNVLSYPSILSVNRLDGKDIVTWEADTGMDVMRYHIIQEEYETDELPWEQYADAGITSCEFEVSEGKHYVYQVEALGTMLDDAMRMKERTKEVAK